jgi:hypothetical protein
VGNNGETLVADSSATTGLRWQEPKNINPIINSSFNNWQRGVSLSTTSSAYTADRYQATGTSNYTVSRQATSDTTNLPNVQYCARIQRNNASTDTATLYWGYTFETVDSIPYAGKTVTWSFYARRSSTFTGGSNQIGVQFCTGTGTDQNAVTGTFTGFATPVNTGSTLTTTWQRFTFTFTLATSVTQIGFRVYMTGVGTAGANDYFEFTAPQLDLGSVATAYRPYSATIQGELAACQRYYSTSYKTGAAVPTAGGAGGLGLMFSYPANASAGWKLGTVIFPQRMRTSPTVTIYSYIAATTNMVTDASGADSSANSGTPYLISEFSAYVYNNSGGTISHSQGGFICHFAASAEL